ncbi:PREDICTED: FBD-associated F-box protein At1g66310 [Theobroma cacao]|uniref:FBD-associated F-box protein At1g66310 n=1 Tax=Theobroma cacao TaxID=3641 RepID=A0AB32W743_THECC|nr:PREDICTED: FBD-associated F-box protein At1g66310 [Theobroma cacao]
MELITFNMQNLCSLYDRFSDLPEPIILHVFSFLGSNDIVRLCYVSRKFRKLCMSSPNLSFKLTFDSEKCTAKCKKLQRFLKDFLSIHNAPEIHRLRLHWFCHSVRYDAKGSIFSLWVQKAVRNKVRELDIGVPVKPHKAFYLPAGVESLRVLKLKLQGGNLKSFASVFASLETLSLNSVSIPFLEFGEWVCNSCKSLKVLNLEKVNGIGNLNISSSSLKVLTIVCCADEEDGLVSDYSVTKDCKIFIDCSSLENLAISKCLFDGLHLNVNAPSLKGLEISDC